MADDPRIDKLYQLGYLWHVKQDELCQLSPDDDELRQAILEIQRRNAEEYAFLVGKHHGDSIIDEGKFGPAVDELILQPRDCPIPDVPPPPEALFHFDDPLIQAAVESQQRSESQGSGSWPYGCWAGYQMHRLVVAVDDRQMDEYWKGRWEEIKARVREVYSWTGLRVDFVDRDERADVRLQFVTVSSGWIGLAEFPDGSCTDEVFCKIKTTYHGPLHRCVNLVLHELGHNNKLQHVRGTNSIMNPVINDATHNWRDDPHWSTLSRYYGGQGSPDILADDPPPQPPPEGEHNGLVVIEGKIYKTRFWEA